MNTIENESMTGFELLRKAVSAYLMIGMIVAIYAWSIDTSPSKAEAWPVLLVIIVLWPLWLTIYCTLG